MEASGKLSKRVVAIGGGGFLMESGPSVLDEYVVRLTGKSHPRICFMPTASGDSHEHIDKYYAAFARFPARLSHLAFFRKPAAGSIALNAFEHELPAQDLIYVGGGNTRSMLAVWREWGVARCLRDALTQGVLLAGVSAGAICWFEWGASDSATPGTGSAALRCLGFLKGSCSPHWLGEPHRRRDFHALLRSGALPGGYGICDGAALVFENGRLVEAVSASSGAGAYRVEMKADRLQESAIPARNLTPGPSAPARG
jgi:peptidase E